MSDTYMLYIKCTKEVADVLIPSVKSYAKTYPKKYTTFYCIQDDYHYFQVEINSSYIYSENKDILSIIELTTYYKQQAVVIQMCDQNTLSSIINEHLLSNFNLSVNESGNIVGFALNANYLIH